MICYADDRGIFQWRHERPHKFFQEGGQRRYFAYRFQVADDAVQTEFTKRFALSKRQRKCPMLRQQSQKCASLAAIARYITIIYTIGKLLMGSSFQKSIATVCNETANFDFILPSTTCQRYLEAKSCKRLGTHSEIKIKP